jgi:hypothetical protein
MTKSLWIMCLLSWLFGLVDFWRRCKVTLAKFIGICKIHAELNISVMNETKWHEILLKLEVFVKKNFCLLLPNFIKGLNKSWLGLHPYSRNENQ